MAVPNKRKRSAVNATAAKIVLTVAAGGASLGGWAALGVTQLHDTAAAAEVTGAPQQTQPLESQEAAAAVPTQTASLPTATSAAVDGASAAAETPSPTQTEVPTPTEVPATPTTTIQAPQSQFP